MCMNLVGFSGKSLRFWMFVTGAVLAGGLVLAVLTLSKTGGSATEPVAAGGSEVVGVSTFVPERPDVLPQDAVVVEPGEPIRLGRLLPFTGVMRPVGFDQIRGMEIAVDAFGPILGHEVDLADPVDTGCSDELVVPGMQSLVSQEDMLGILGLSCFEMGSSCIPGFGCGVNETLSPRANLLPLVSKAGMVLGSGAASGTGLTSDLEGNVGRFWEHGFFRTVPNDVVVAEAVASFVVDHLEARRAAALYLDGFYGGFGAPRDSADSFTEALSEKGGIVTETREIHHNDLDALTPLLESIAEGQPEVLYLMVGSPDLEWIVQYSRQIPELVDVEFLGTEADAWVDAEYVQERAESEGMYFVGPSFPELQAEGYHGLSYRELVQRFREHTSGEEPVSPYFAHTYDATMILLAAIEEAAVGNSDGMLVVDRRRVRDAIYSTRDFPGVTGMLDCDEFGDCGSQRISVYQHPPGEDLPVTNSVFDYRPSS